MSVYYDEMTGNVWIPPRNRMSGKVNVIAVGEKDLTGSLTVKRFQEVSGHVDVYSDYVIEDIAYPPRFGYQKRSSISIFYRKEVYGNIRIPPKNKMSGIIDIIQPPRKTLEIEPVKDSFIREGVRTLNYGREQTMLVGYNDKLKERYRSLLEFNLDDLPENTIIEKATLKLYNASPFGVKRQLGVYTSKAHWEEYGVTWENQPGVSSLVALSDIGNAVGYYEVDVTETIQLFYSGEEKNYGFIIKALNEDFAQFEQFNTRENLENKPILEIAYYDDTIYSFGRSEIESNLFVHAVGNKDVKGTINIREFDDSATISSNIHIYNPIFMESCIRVNRTFTNSSLTIRRTEREDMLSNLKIRISRIDEIKSNLSVNARNRLGQINIPYKSSIDSNLSVRQAKTDSLISIINVNAKYRVGTITIPNISTIVGSVTVRDYEESHLTAKIRISKPLIHGSLRIKQSNYGELVSGVSVARNESDSIDSGIYINRPFIHGYIKVVASSFVNGNLMVKKIDEIPSILTIPERTSINGSIDIIHTSLIPSSIQILSGYLKSSITIPKYETYDTLGRIKVRVKWIDEISCSLTVGGDNVPGGYTFIL